MRSYAKSLGRVQSLLVIFAVLMGASVVGILTALGIAALFELLLSRIGVSREGVSLCSNGAVEERAGIEADAARFAALAFTEKLATYLNSASFVIFLIAGLHDEATIQTSALGEAAPGGGCPAGELRYP